ncbi:MAG: hypothetical protein KJO29_05755, partial [Bacteroidia bacterium]|nr:hypothetical protein [Bacteroidia bacterium]
GLPKGIKSTKPFTSNILGQEESCMTCHAEMTGFAPSHNPQVIGCTPCHLGNPNEDDKDLSHQNMVLVPGNLSNADQTCGTVNCHHELLNRIENSLMNTMSGAVTVNRFFFGDSEVLSAHANVRELTNDIPSDDHFRHLCASCHLGNEKSEPAPVSELSRGGGCIACHLDYTEANLIAHQEYIDSKKTIELDIHPAINLNVTNEHCFGCHSRSGRISTNYEGWHETRLSKSEMPNDERYRLLEDGRVFEFISADVHHKAGMECIDCHTAVEVMGDGNRYFHSEEAVKIQCEDCHTNQAPVLSSYESLDIESKKILQLRGIDEASYTFVVGKESGRPYVNVVSDSSGKLTLLRKNTGEQLSLIAPNTICTKGDAHQSLSCSACHTSWAPQCIGCHTAYDPNQNGYDLLAHKPTHGKWEEYLGEFFAGPPTLGVVENLDADSNISRKVKTFIPGMIATVDQSAFPDTKGDEDSLRFHRLFSPTSAHTTSKGRDCVSCHQDPLAIGYGRGKLEFKHSGKDGRWFFESEYVSSEFDGHPQDAWIGFLEYPDKIAATRSNARPFNIEEQKRIMTVGVCLKCHQPNSMVMYEGLEDFDKVLEDSGKECVIPIWD